MTPDPHRLVVRQGHPHAPVCGLCARLRLRLHIGAPLVCAVCDRPPREHDTMVLPPVRRRRRVSLRGLTLLGCLVLSLGAWGVGIAAVGIAWGWWG